MTLIRSVGLRRGIGVPPTGEPGGEPDDGQAFRYFRLNVTANNGRSTLNVAELELRESVGGADVIPALVTGVASASTEFSSTYAAAKAVDDAPSTFWSTSTSTGWLQIDLGAGNEIVLAEYAITARDTAGTGDGAPRDWTLEGSADGATWTVLDTVTGEASWGSSEVRAYAAEIIAAEPGPEPTVDLLTYAPPDGWEVYPVTIVPTSGGILTLDDDTHHLLVFPATPVANPVQPKGGKNVVMIAGEIRRDDITYTTPPAANEATQDAIRVHDSDDEAARTANAGRIVHVEGILAHGYGLSDGIRADAQEVDLRIQNCRVELGMWYREAEDGGSPHGDALQPYGGLSYLRVDGLTALLPGQGLMLKPDFGRVNAGHMELRRVNLRAQTNPDTEYLDPSATYPTPAYAQDPRYWLWLNGNEGGVRLHRGTVHFAHPTRTIVGGNMFWPEGGATGSDELGTYANPIHTVGWDGTGPGYIYEGDPPDGDYVRKEDVGIGYTSPGYISDAPAAIAGAGSVDETQATHPSTEPVYDADLYVDPALGSGGTGSGADPYGSLHDAIAAASAGQTIAIYAGTAVPASRYIVDKALRICGYGTARPIFDGTELGTGSAGRMFTVTAPGTHIHTLEIRNCDGDGGPCYTDVADVTFDDLDIHHCLGGGVYFYGPGVTSGLAQDIHTWHLGDGTTMNTNVPDGIVVTGGGSNVEIIRPVVADAPDDGIDLIDASGCRVRGFVILRPGHYWNGNPGGDLYGDGTGVKLGGAAGSNGNRAVDGIVISARTTGVAHNQADGGIVVERVTTIDCGEIGVDVGSAVGNVVRDSIDHGSATAHYAEGDAVSEHNTWDLAITDPVFADAAGGDYSLADGSPCLGVASDGGNIGASTATLSRALDWLARNLT